MAELNMKELLTLLLRHYRLLFAATIVTGIAGTAITFLLTPVYRAEIVLLPAERPGTAGYSRRSLGSIGGLAELAGINVGPGDLTEEAFATLYSRTFLQSFILENSLLPVLFSSGWDAESNEWKVSNDSRPTLYDGYRMLTENVMSLRISAGNPVIRFRIDWSDPDIAALWANQLISKLNERLRQRAIEEAQKSIEFLEAELANSNILEIQQRIYFLIEGRIQEIMLANVQTEYAFRIIDVALPPDRDDWSKPNRPLIIAASLAMGLILGVLVVLVRHSIRED